MSSVIVVRALFVRCCLAPLADAREAVVKFLEMGVGPVDEALEDGS